MKKFWFAGLLIFAVLLITDITLAQQTSTKLPFPKIGIDVGTADSPEDISVTLQILLLMTI